MRLLLNLKYWISVCIIKTGDLCSFRLSVTCYYCVTFRNSVNNQFVFFRSHFFLCPCSKFSVFQFWRVNHRVNICLGWNICFLISLIFESILPEICSLLWLWLLNSLYFSFNIFLCRIFFMRDPRIFLRLFGTEFLFMLDFMSNSPLLLQINTIILFFPFSIRLTEKNVELKRKVTPVEMRTSTQL